MDGAVYFDKLRLDGQVAVVTGGGRSIGLACSMALSEAGARVTIADRDPLALRHGLERLSLLGAAEAVLLDVADASAVDTLARSIADKHGRVDVLVNCAGVGRPGVGGEDITDADWNDVLRVNLDGTYFVARAIGRIMLEQRKGSIVNIGSMAGEIVVRPQKNVHYNASKAAVHHVTRSLAAEWAGRGVRVNAIAPGFIDTPMNAYAIQEELAMAEMWIGNTPMNRLGQPDEVASVALFLASEASSFMTGAIVVVDGGYTLW